MNRRLVLTSLVIFALVSVALLAGSVPAAAQDTVAGWRTVAGGDEILALAADPWSPGFLWAGTEGGGVFIWDVETGVVQDQIAYPDEPGLLSNTIYDIAFGAGDAWLATSAGVARLLSSGEWLTYGVEDGLPSIDITAVAVAGDGSVWAGTRSDGIALLVPGAQTWLVFNYVEGDPEAGPGADNIADLVVDIENEDRLYVAHGRTSSADRPALSTYDPALDLWETIPAVGPAGDPTQGPAGDQIMALALDEITGELWLGSWAEGVLYYSGEEWNQYQVGEGVCGRSVWAIAAQDGFVWAACGDDNGGSGASLWDGQAWETWRSGDLPTDVITAFAFLGGMTYLGTNGPGDAGSGIVPFDVEPLDPLTTGPDYPWSNDILALEFEDDGTLWVGTRGFGLMRYDGSYWDHFTQDSTEGMLAGDTITDLAVRQGELWISSTKTLVSGTSYSDGGVSILDTDSLEWGIPLRSEGDAACLGLPDDEVSSLAVASDAHETVWMGIGIGSSGPGHSKASHQGEGVVAYDPQEDSWQCFTYEETGAGTGLAGNTVLGIDESGGTLWFAAAYHTSAVDGRKYGGGVSRYDADGWLAWGDGDAGLVTYSAAEGLDRDPITGDVRSVYVDGDGRTWAGTWDLEFGDLTSTWPFVDAVVNRLEDDVWSADSFPGSGWISDIIEDEDGWIWVGTTRGHIQEYSPSGGLPADTATGGAHVWDGADWIGCLPPESTITELEPSGIAARAITALALHPLTGEVWIGTENGGLSVYRSGETLPTDTPPAGGGTRTPTPRPTASRPSVATLEHTPAVFTPRATATRGPTPTPTPADDDEPQPPPEIPEAGTLVLLGAGLAGLAGWVGIRRRRDTAR